MRFFEEESVIFLCIVVASLAEVFDTLVQVLKIPIPNNFITFTAIILFFVSLLLKETRKNTLGKECLSEREKSIKNYANLSLKESTILKKYNKQSLYKLIIFFSLAWIVISTIFILFFANYFDKRHQLSWELILFFVVLFAIIGFAILAMSIISELKNTFPDFRKVFEKYGYEAFENGKGYIENEKWDSIKIHQTNVYENFLGYLKNKSIIKYRIDLSIDNEFEYALRNVNITTVNINIDITINMKNVLKDNQFDLLNKNEILNRFSKYYSGKEIIKWENIQYNSGFFEISLEEEINKNMSFDYLVAVIKACQELEDTFNFPLEKLR